MESLGTDLAELPLPAVIILAAMSSGLVIALSTIGVPASFGIISTVTIVGLDWGRVSRTATLTDAVRGRNAPQVSVGALTTDQGASTVDDPELDSSVDGGYGAIGEESTEDILVGSALFDPETTARVIAMQNVVPIVATIGSVVTRTVHATSFHQAELQASGAHIFCMEPLEKIKQREDIVRIVSTVTLAAIAVRSFLKGKRGRGVLAAGGAVAIGATTSTLKPTALEVGHEAETASEAETTAEDGAMVCAICNELIVTGESRRPNENDEIVHEACL